MTLVFPRHATTPRSISLSTQLSVSPLVHKFRTNSGLCFNISAIYHILYDLYKERLTFNATVYKGPVFWKLNILNLSHVSG
jgi:hypothetical protein